MENHNEVSNGDENLLIILPMEEPKELLQSLRSRFPTYTITYFELKWSGSDAWKGAKDVPVELYRDTTILFTLSALPPDPKADAPKLRHVQLFSAGVDAVLSHPIYTETDIIITTSNGVHGPQIAEWCVMTALVQSHNYNAMHDWQKEHKWGKSVDDMAKVQDKAGQRLGVLGYGSIGRQAGRVFKAMGMDVVAYTASPKNTQEERRDDGYIVPGTGDPEGEFPSAWYSGLDKKSLHNFLSQDLDMLLVSVPLTKETRHFISSEEFSILRKRRTFVSNMSRGQIIDQAALITALRNGDIRGAALDVTDPEPLPGDSELWDFDNCTITPHISGLGANYAERSFAILAGNMERHAKGQKMWNVVRRERGY